MYSRRHNKVSVPFFSGVTVFVTVCHRLQPFRFLVVLYTVFVTLPRELVSAELEGIAILRGIAWFADRFLPSDTTLGVLGARNGTQTDCRGSDASCK